MIHIHAVAIVWIAILLAVVFLLWASNSGRHTSRCPDGRCVVCRRGRCWPGDTCDKCGAEQP